MDRSRDSTLNRPPCFNAFVASLDVLTIDAPCTRFDKERKREGERSKRFTMGIQFFGDDSVRIIKKKNEKKKERMLKNVDKMLPILSSWRTSSERFCFFFHSRAKAIDRHGNYQTLVLVSCAPTCVNLIFVRDRA